MPSLHLKTTVTATLVLFFLGISPAMPAARNYDIELIIFKYSGVEQYSAEHWPDRWPVPDMQNSIDLKDVPREYRSDFIPLGPSVLTLNDVVDTLEKSRRYQVLIHTGWRQPGLDKNNAVNIKIEAGQLYRRITPLPAPPAAEGEEPVQITESLFISRQHPEPGLNDDSVASNNLTADESNDSMATNNLTTVDNEDSMTTNELTTIEYEAIDSVPDGMTEKPVYELSGNFMVVISRFIHVYTDLLLREPVTLKLEEAAPVADAYTNTDSETLAEKPKYRLVFSQPDLSFTTLHGFHIREHRRMRRDELHFIDHPLLGIIVKASAAPDKEQNTAAE